MRNESPNEEDEMRTYGDPVKLLLPIGETRLTNRPEDWEPYPERYGLGQDDIPELIRMAEDPELSEVGGDEPRGWAPIHAVRALGQLRAEEAISSLIELLGDYSEDDYFVNSIPPALGLIGPSALPAVWAYLDDTSRDDEDRTTILDAVESIAEHHPEAHDEVVQGLIQRLTPLATNSDLMNSYLISVLTDLGTREALPLMRQAFEAERVEEDFITWHEIRRDFGLTEADPLDHGPPEPRAGLRGLESGTRLSTKRAPKKKDKRRAEKKAKRRNRKKK